MKNKILDEPIHNYFFDFSEKGEKILWEDHIKEQPLFSIIEMIPVVFFISIVLSFQSFSFLFIIISIFSFSILMLILYSKFTRIKKQKQTRYALTPKRIILQHYIYDRLVIDQILLEDIARIFVTVNHFNFRVGDIYLLIKNQKKEQIKTYHPYYGKPSPVPTIYQINNPKEVIKLINEQLKNTNASL
jgi:hypothetical protein